MFESTFVIVLGIILAIIIIGIFILFFILSENHDKIKERVWPVNDIKNVVYFHYWHTRDLKKKKT